MVLEDLWSAIIRDGRYVPQHYWRRVEPNEKKRTQLLRPDQSVPEEAWKKIVRLAREDRTRSMSEQLELERFRHERARTFFGRTEIIKQLVSFLLRPGANNSVQDMVRIVHAPPGRGKTALLCKLAEELRVIKPTIDVIECYIGATNRLSDEIGLQRRILDLLEPQDSTETCEQIAALNPDRISAKFKAALRRRQKPLAILIDAVDQLQFGSDLYWLPRDVLPKVKFIVSCVELKRNISDSAGELPFEPLAKIRERYPETDVALSPLESDDVREIAATMLSDYGKKLGSAPLQEIANLQPAREPLYLAVLMRELRALSGQDINGLVGSMIAQARDKTPNVEALFSSMIKRLEVFGPRALAEWFQALMLAREGLSPAVCSEVLAAHYCEKGDLGEKGRRKSHRIRRAIRPYLQTREGRLEFFHQALTSAVRRAYPIKNRAVTHAKLAAALNRVWHERNDFHALAEYLYHLIEAGDWDSVFEVMTNHKKLAERFEKLRDGHRFTLDIDAAYNKATKEKRFSVARNIIRSFIEILESNHVQSTGFNLSKVNSWLLYRKSRSPSNSSFYEILIRTGAQSDKCMAALRDLAENKRNIVFRSRNILAGVLRRNGRLDEAESMLRPLFNDRSVRMANNGPSVLQRLSVRLCGIVRYIDELEGLNAYELGYLVFLRGDLRGARSWFLYGTACCHASGDETGAWISRCLAANCDFIDGYKVRKFLATLKKAQIVFERRAEEGDPNAQRWIFNMFKAKIEASVASNNPTEARCLYVNLFDNPWVKENADTRFLRWYDGLVAATEGRHRDAVKIFRQFFEEMADNVPEEHARHLMHFGSSLHSAGDEQAACNAWHAALGLPEDNGNRPWQRRIRIMLKDM